MKMSNAIRLLEALGSQPAHAAVASAAYEAAVAGLEIEEPQRTALRGRDVDALAGLLKGRTAMLCLICGPEDESEHQVVPDDGDSNDDMVPDDQQGGDKA
jgi:hypothetical protein